MMQISKDTVITALITFVLGILGAVVVIWAHLDEKPRISAVGEYAAWTTPPDGSFSGFQSYSQIDVRNVGSTVAKDIKVQTPFRGILTVNDKKTESGEFENNFSLQDLNPGEGYLLKIWAHNSVPDYFLDVVITHTRGTVSVDFGYRAKGIVGWISKSLDTYGSAYLIIFFLVILFVAIYIYESRNEKEINPV